MIEPKFKVGDLIMTKEEELLLLKDLSARLPYGVMFDYNDNEPLEAEGIVRNIVYFRGYNYQTGGDECYAHITKCKPYLRPMSSMTEEERRTYDNLACDFDGISMATSVDWLNENKFDYRGLIPMGLAFEAPEDMYK